MNEVVLSMRDKIDRFQFEASKLPQVPMPTFHHFANGMYARECHIPAGTVFVGQVHTQEHFFMMLKGAAQVTTDQGLKLMLAPTLIVSPPGTKRAGFTIQDTIFLAIHRTDSRDIDEIRREVTEHDPLETYDAQNNPEALKHLEGV